MTYLDRALLETLLNGSVESSVLDFKRDQYPIVRASDEQKGELIKDILAFANAWKTSDAHIVIGVEKSGGGRATVVGGIAHVDDATLQQIVNAKTNRPVSFQYIPVEFEGQSIAVICIAEAQARPIYLGKKFGKLEADAVYVRRGSSTDTARLEEIEKMWQADRAPAPVLTLGLRAKGTRDPAARTIALRSIDLRERPPPTPEEREALKDLAASLVPNLRSFAFPQFAFAREVALARPYSGPSRDKIREYVKDRARLLPVVVEVTNQGEVVADHVRVELRTPYTAPIDLRDESPKRPRGPMDFVYPDYAPNLVWVRSTDEEHFVELHLRKIQPGQTVLSDPFWIGATVDVEVSFAARVFGDNIRKPIDETLTINFQVGRGSLEEAEETFEQEEKEGDRD